MSSKDLTVIPAGGGALAPREIDAERLLAQWKAGRSPETLRAYEADVEHFAQWSSEPNGAAAIDKLMRIHPGRANEIAHGYRSAMVDEGLAPATINRRLSALRSLVKIGKLFGFTTWDLEVANVTSEAYRDTAGPAKADIVRVLKLAAAHASRPKALRDVALLMLLYTLALRRNEALSLDLVHFDSRAAKVKVLRKRKREREDKSLPPATLKALRAWVAVRGREPGPLFCSFRNGVPQGRLTGDGLHDMMAKWGVDLDILLRPHGLRHSAITDVLDRTNGNVRAARKFSGHANVETLIKYDDNRADMGGDLAKQIAVDLASVVDEMEGGDDAA